MNYDPYIIVMIAWLALDVVGTFIDIYLRVKKGK
jgi:hypothetical protein